MGSPVEVVRDGGQRELVAVKLGLFDTADGRVEVEVELAEGDQVVVPSTGWRSCSASTCATATTCT